ncbi:hypothetical protein, partial [Thomasclavelia cocleata]|uniref:hypothetical protein n=1 Tax=Thomasclavelia cocleata TaxID=69824 RepID=UPI00256EA212
AKKIMYFKALSTLYGYNGGLSTFTAKIFNSRQIPITRDSTPILFIIQNMNSIINKQVKNQRELATN